MGEASVARGGEGRFWIEGECVFGGLEKCELLGLETNTYAALAAGIFKFLIDDVEERENTT
jgi:hypothetical protein